MTKLNTSPRQNHAQSSDCCPHQHTRWEQRWPLPDSSPATGDLLKTATTVERHVSKQIRRQDKQVCKVQLSYRGNRWQDHASSWSTNHEESSRLWLQYHWSHRGGRLLTYGHSWTPRQTEKRLNVYARSKCLRLNWLRLKGSGPVCDFTCPHWVCSPTEVGQLIVEDDARSWGVNGSSESIQQNKRTQ